VRALLSSSPPRVGSRARSRLRVALSVALRVANFHLLDQSTDFSGADAVGKGGGNLGFEPRQRQLSGWDYRIGRTQAWHELTEQFVAELQ
jgi:hypothetical protein